MSDPQNQRFQNLRNALGFIAAYFDKTEEGQVLNVYANFKARIKENYNLDLLEMSEDEDDFENIQQDKFVNLKKIVYMKCIYNKKFKKWQPIELVNYGEKLLLKNEILNLEK